ncbi:MAG: hypothetical protein J2P18_01400 [Nocardia sp.]|nr:hypothetical protein [Nocardia sp.]
MESTTPRRVSNGRKDAADSTELDSCTAGLAGLVGPRDEYQSLQPTEGKWHLTKAVEYQRGLSKWLMDKKNTDPADRAVAIKELQNLMDALGGK